MTTAHSLFSASASERWSNCPGSLAMSRGIPSTSTPAAREGTAGHEIADLCLKGSRDPSEWIGEILTVEGSEGDDQKVYEVEVTEELADAVAVYVEYVRGFSGTMISEIRVDYSELLGVEEEEGFGTSDTLILDETTLHSFDLKLGRRYVSSEKNKQMILYTAGSVKHLMDIGEVIEKVVLHIVQPRISDAPAPYEMTVDELFDIVAWLRGRAQIATEALFSFTSRDDLRWTSTYLQAGEKQCEWCPAAAFCPTLRNIAREHIDEDFDVLSLQDTVSGEEIAEAMEILPLLEIFIDAIKAEANRRLAHGAKVPGWKLVKGREGNRKWADEKAAEEAFSAYDTRVTHAPAQLLSPSKLETALKKHTGKSKKEVEGIIAKHIVRNPARPTLVAESDPREPWSEAASVDEFEVLA